ncbi:MAG: hypothetical protein GX410_06005 [Elusimicrobia bacterium]|nr:hypothetical protein [Elusimicrobiota bacterium]
MKFLFLCGLLCLGAHDASAQDRQSAALLWIPAAGSDITAELDALDKCAACRLTIALSPEQAVPALRTRLREEARKGRLELAVRAAGDPPLPLLFSPDSPEVRWRGKAQTALWGSRLDILASVVFQARNSHEEMYGAPPSGFVPAGGGAIPQMLELLSAYEISWLAAGPADSAPFTVTLSSGILLLPFHPADSMEALGNLLMQAGGRISIQDQNPPQLPEEDEDTALAEPSAIAEAAQAQSTAAVQSAAAPGKNILFAVVDESLSAPESYRPLLAEFMSAQESGQDVEWLTVSSAAAASFVSAAALANFPPPWTEDYSAWAGSLKQRAALHTLGELRRAINVAANSTSGGHVKPKLVSGLEQLERGDKLLLFASTDTATASAIEEEFRQKVATLYRQAGLTVPPSLRDSLAIAEPEVGDEAPQISTASAAIKAGDSYLLIENPQKQLRIPAKYHTLPGGADPQQLFNLQSILVSWDEKTIKFTLRNRRPERQDRPLLRQFVIADLYMDINSRRNSGTGIFLPERRLSPNPDDAWEYAVSFSGQKAQVYKTSLAGIQAGRSYNTRQDKSGDISVEIPRSEFRGNPKLWGYTALIMAASDTSSDSSSPEQNADGDTVLDWMAADKMGSSLSSLHAADRL